MCNIHHGGVQPRFHIREIMFRDATEIVAVLPPNNNGQGTAAAFYK
jgi:hypothetical protein